MRPHAQSLAQGLHCWVERGPATHFDAMQCVVHVKMIRSCSVPSSIRNMQYRLDGLPCETSLALIAVINKPREAAANDGVVEMPHLCAPCTREMV